MAELVELRVPLPPNERSYGPFVCKTFLRQAPDWAYRVESTRAKPAELSFELYEGPSGA